MLMAGLYFEEFEIGGEFHQEYFEFEHTMTNQRGEVVASCRRTGLMHCKPKA